MKQVWKRKNQQRLFKANIQATFNRATPQDIHTGTHWYLKAATAVTSIADKYNLEAWRVAGVVAVLSPSMPWHRNVKTAEHFITSTQANVDVLASEFKAGAYGFKNKRTALDYMTCEPADSSYSLPRLGPKTGAFYWNLLGDLKVPTIDGHMYACMLGDQHASTHEIYAQHGRLTGKRYKVLADALVTAADSNRLLPAVFQAITWTVWRRLKNENSELRQGGYRQDSEVPF